LEKSENHGPADLPKQCWLHYWERDGNECQDENKPPAPVCASKNGTKFSTMVKGLGRNLRVPGLYEVVVMEEHSFLELCVGGKTG